MASKVGFVDKLVSTAKGLFKEEGFLSANHKVEARFDRAIEAERVPRINKLRVPETKETVNGNTIRMSGIGTIPEGTDTSASIGDHAFGGAKAIKDAAKEYFWTGLENRGLTGTQRAARIGGTWMGGTNLLRLANGGTPTRNVDGEFDIAGLPF